VRIVVLHNDTPLEATSNFEQAIRATTGDVVVLSDQDDVWHPDRVAHALRALGDDALLHFSDARLVDARGEQLSGSLFGMLEIAAADLSAISDGGVFATLLRRYIATGATVAFRRSLYRCCAPVSG
jgi:hypothetical protein